MRIIRPPFQRLQCDWSKLESQVADSFSCSILQKNLHEMIHVQDINTKLFV